MLKENSCQTAGVCLPDDGVSRQSYSADFFLGSLSPSGFTGWFAQAAAEPGLRAYLIKSGPGCGKSTLIKRLAKVEACQPHSDAEAPAPFGSQIERLHCSSDPDSLDGVVLPCAHAIVLDATAPHTLDCKYPGAVEQVVSLYHTLDGAQLFAEKANVLRHGSQNAELLSHASGYYAMACALWQRRRACAANAMNADAVRAFANHLATRLFPSKANVSGSNFVRYRLLSAPTPDGLTVFWRTIPALANTVYAIHDSYGAVSNLLLRTLVERAEEKGISRIECRCSTDQHGKIDHLILPQLRLAFVTVNSWHNFAVPGQKNLHASRWMRRAALQKRQAWLSCEKRMASELLVRTCGAMTAAKAEHDALEQFYIAATDFCAVDAAGAALKNELWPIC